MAASTSVYFPLLRRCVSSGPKTTMQLLSKRTVAYPVLSERCTASIHSWDSKKGLTSKDLLENSLLSTTQVRLMGKSPNKVKQQEKAAHAKNKVISVLSNKLRGACKMGGKLETNPKKNYNLAKVIAEVEKAGMNKGTIQRLLASAEKQYPEFELLAVGPSGSNILVHCSARSNGLAKQMISTAAKKSKFQVKMATDNIIALNFEKRGIVVVPQPIKGKVLNEEEATDLAIEIGAEDVDEVSDSSISFMCAEFDVNEVEKALNAMEITPDSATVEHVPNQYIDLPEDYDLLYNAFLKKLDGFSNEVDIAFEVLNITTNFELD